MSAIHFLVVPRVTVAELLQQRIEVAGLDGAYTVVGRCGPHQQFRPRNITGIVGGVSEPVRRGNVTQVLNITWNIGVAVFSDPRMTGRKLRVP